MKTLPLLAAALLATTTATHAASVTETYGPFTPGTLIADGDPSLSAFLFSIDSSAILSLSEVTIQLELRGTPAGTGFASDMFASLIRTPSGASLTDTDPAAVLINRLGVTESNPVGFAYDGWDVTFSDAASTDIHSEYLDSGVLVGSFQPDGRLTPTAPGTARPAVLGIFVGLGGNGDWRLNIGDLHAGGTMALVSWTLTLTGDNQLSPVPEAPAWTAGAAMTALFIARAWKRARRS
jgi:hypothetical protein